MSKLFNWVKKLFEKEVISELYTDRLTKNFKQAEVLPPKVKWEELDERIRLNLINTISLAQRVRDDANVPVNINTEVHKLRGLRLKEHQEYLIKKGFTTTKNSKHLEGKALDLASELKVSELGNICRRYFNTVIEYPKRGFVHVDTDLRNGRKYFGVKN